MFKNLLNRLGLNEHEKATLGESASKIKDISEYLSDVIETAKDADYFEAVTKSAPWAGSTVDALGEVLPPVKFAAKLFEGLTKEHDPQALGHLACTLAYQRAIEQTVKAMEVPIVSVKEVKDIKKQLSDLEADQKVPFDNFSFTNALTHPFIQKADMVLKLYSNTVGYNDEQYRRLLSGVHMRFVGELKTLLSNGSLKDRFEPFTNLMGLGTVERQAYRALSDHAEYERWLFERAPVLKKEPYALSDIYVNTDCGELSWAEIKKGSEKSGTEKPQFIDPFAEQNGGRKPLLETVLSLIGDPGFKDAIVIQGAAGAGKSAFTLKLSSELLRQGLRPIRIRLKDVRLDLHVSEALPAAVRLGDEDYTSDMDTIPDDLFISGTIFRERVEFRGTSISPYVLILDGWDEISIAANEGFKVRVAKLLDELRSEYLRDTPVPIRVILTGRPSTDVTESKFFRDRTRVLTIRTLTPDMLEVFVRELQTALLLKPVSSVEATWSIKDLKVFNPIFENYRNEFEATLQAAKKASETKTAAEMPTVNSGSMAVLGLPLLAHLAIRMIAQWPGDSSEIVSNPTTLYRSLVDLTTEQSGKAPEELDEIEGQLRLSGLTLRNLLWQTATAMTILGEESIPYSELELRLGEDVQSLDSAAEKLTKENILSSLMISFYFKGGQTQLGAEFVHKSFREYLFAESIIELLKTYGESQNQVPQERFPYWKEFPEGDLRLDFTYALSKHLAPQWISPDVGAHLERLLRWEINRTDEKQAMSGPGTTTFPLSLAGWEKVRDALADVWDWWCEGVHLRPQPSKDRSGIYNFSEPYVQELITTSSPQEVQQKLKPQTPTRTVTMDAHLGDGLFRLTELVHYLVALRRGWLNKNGSGELATPEQLWEGITKRGDGPRRYQCRVQRGVQSWILFAPSGVDPSYFQQYCNRINGAGWRPDGPFPLGLTARGMDLRDVILRIPYSNSNEVTTWVHSNMAGADGTGGNFFKHDFGEILATDIELNLGALVSASFKKALLTGANINYGLCLGTNFEDAVLTGAKFIGAHLDFAKFNRADLRNSKFINASIHKTTVFDDAEMENALIDLDHLAPDLDYAKL